MPARASYRKDRRAWYVFFELSSDEPGRPIRWSQKIGSKKADGIEARAIASAFNLELEKRQGRAAQLYPGAPAPFDLVARAWWDAREPRMPNSSRSSRRPVVFERLIPFFGSLDARKIDEDLIVKLVS
jgi:hypothetical protein